MRKDNALPHAGLFLDRDGVIIENVAKYVRTHEDIRYIPGALDALARIREASFQIVIVSNQSAVGRGLIGPEQAYDIQQTIVRGIEAAGGRIDGSYLCFHQPSDQCDCRKPKPGLIFQAAKEMGLDVNKSILIGDAASDVRAALAAGIGRIALVQTGRGKNQLGFLSKDERGSVDVFPDLAIAIKRLVY